MSNEYTIEKRNADALAIFTMPEGERLLAHLVSQHVSRLSYTKGDPVHTAKREGNREVVLDLIGWVTQEKNRRKRGGPEPGTGTNPTAETGGDGSLQSDA